MKAVDAYFLLYIIIKRAGKVTVRDKLWKVSFERRKLWGKDITV